MTDLYWLPAMADWRGRLRALRDAPWSAELWDEAVALANARLDFVQTAALDGALGRRFGERVPGELGRALATKPVRLALLGSSTLAHLHPAIRIAALRRGMWVTTYENAYGQYWQELNDPGSALYRFGPSAVLIALDAHDLAAGIDAGMAGDEVEGALAEVERRIVACWRRARAAFRCPILHQLPLPLYDALLGSNEHRLPGSRAAFIARLTAELRPLADAEGVDLVALDARVRIDGLDKWHDPMLWHRAKQEVSPSAAPFYGELVARLLAAKEGRSRKALVLDLDNTLWGGVVGEDGLAGLVLGQGSALGEAFSAFQAYAGALSRRGVILAVCSKNDEANALEPFERHPEMVLRHRDIACFVANWSDKAENLRRVALELNIGLDALVFVDDNPFERDLVRRELPMVAVPEMGEDPALFPRTLADAGYFEAVAVTPEDRARAAHYEGNRRREELRVAASDLGSYLRGLEMRLVWSRFDRVGLQRTVQLINKTNQFNLTTRRYAEDDILEVMDDGRAFGLQLRLIDRFGDNGVIAIVIGRMNEDDDLIIDTWLMSCRVLGRQIEPTTLNLIAAQASGLGARRLLGEYIPTKKNAMVKDHYAKLGFTVLPGDAEGGLQAVLDLTNFRAADTFVAVREGRADAIG